MLTWFHGVLLVWWCVAVLFAYTPAHSAPLPPHCCLSFFLSLLIISRYKAVFSDGTEKIVENPSDYPKDPPRGMTLQEPMVTATLVFPEEYLGKMITLCQARRGMQQSLDFMNADRVILVYRLPLNEVVEDFFDAVKVRIIS